MYSFYSFMCTCTDIVQFDLYFFVVYELPFEITG